MFLPLVTPKRRRFGCEKGEEEKVFHLLEMIDIEGNKFLLHLKKFPQLCL